MTSYMSVPIGSDVYTSDGDKLGKIKEVRDTYFKVDSSMKPDYWLSTDCILGGSGAADRVTVTFVKDRLNDHKVDLEQ